MALDPSVTLCTKCRPESFYAADLLINLQLGNDSLLVGCSQSSPCTDARTASSCGMDRVGSRHRH